MRFANTDVDRSFKGYVTPLQIGIVRVWDNPRRLRTAPPSCAKGAKKGYKPTLQLFRTEGTIQGLSQLPRWNPDTTSALHSQSC